jgi:hypothetical protein
MTELEAPQTPPDASYGLVIIEVDNEADTSRDTDDHRYPEADCEPKHPEVPPATIDDLPL